MRELIIYQGSTSTGCQENWSDTGSYIQNQEVFGFELREYGHGLIVAEDRSCLSPSITHMDYK